MMEVLESCAPAGFPILRGLLVRPLKFGKSDGA